MDTHFQCFFSIKYRLCSIRSLNATTLRQNVFFSKYRILFQYFICINCRRLSSLIHSLSISFDIFNVNATILRKKVRLSSTTGCFSSKKKSLKI